MSDKNHKAVVVTGTSGDIGAAIASAFSGENYFVLGIDSRENPDVKLDAFIRQDLYLLSLDKKARDTFSKQLYSLIHDKSLSVLVNNAAVQIPGAIDEISVDDFVKSLHVNAVAPFILTQICLEYLGQSGGHVINIGSVHAQCTKPGFSAYAASKAALAGLTRSLAVELGTAGIRVNCIQPGAVETGMLEAGFADYPDKLQKLREYIPVGRTGLPADIAALVLFLAGQENSYITGASIAIDGGISSRLHDPD